MNNVGLDAVLKIRPPVVRQQEEMQEKADLWRLQGEVGKYSVTEAKEGSGISAATFTRERWEGQRPRRGSV